MLQKFHIRFLFDIAGEQAPADQRIGIDEGQPQRMAASGTDLRQIARGEAFQRSFAVVHFVGIHPQMALFDATVGLGIEQELGILGHGDLGVENAQHHLGSPG